MAEDDHAEEERLAVIAKYDKGREEGAQIDDWEDPAFEIYHVTDRYGFIHDRVLPKLKADEIRRINVEQERADKWAKMIAPSKWPKFKNSEKLRSRIYKGIPDKMRVSAWKLLLDLDVIKKQQEGKYHEMYLLARKYSQDVRQIDLDVNRTYRDTRMFRERYGREQKALFNVLCAYSVYNSEVGYCQGMSQLAALLLMYMEEEDAFWALSQLMTNPKYGMHGFFIAGFPKLLRFQTHHDRVLKVMLPRLKKHFDKHGVDSGLYTLKWFFQCFLDRVPFELSLRLWDIFLLEGDRVLICGAFAILRMHQKQLLARKNMDDILGYIQSVIPTNFGVELDKAVLNYQQFADDLRSRKLDTGGEPSDDELPKKPFGVIEIKPPPIKRQVVVEKDLPKPQAAEETTNQDWSATNTISFDEADEDEEPEVSVLDRGSLSHLSNATSLSTSSRVQSPNMTSLAESTPTPAPVSALPCGQVANGPTETSPPLPPSAKMNGLSHSIPVRKTSPSPPPPPPRSPQSGVLVSSASRNANRSASPLRQSINTSFQNSSTSAANPAWDEVTVSSSSGGRVPPPVMPRKTPIPYSLEQEESSSVGGSSERARGAVRIHVPYAYNSQTSGVAASSTSSSSSPANPRSLELNRSDPNRVKIDVSSRTNSTLIQ